MASKYGVTIGAHRLFAHKSFKARPILKATLLILQTLAGQVSIYLKQNTFKNRYYQQVQQVVSSHLVIYLNCNIIK